MLIKRIRIPLFLLTILFTTLVIRCGSGDIYSDDSLIQRDITAAVNDYNSDDWRIRLNALIKVSKYSDTAYAKNIMLLLLKATEDSHSEIRIESLKILRTMKAHAAEERIRDVAVNDENSNVRYFAISALAEYMATDNEKTFITALEDKDWLVREASIKGLMTINDSSIQKKHIDLIISYINDENISIRLAAISSIRIKDPKIYSELSRIINNKKSGSYLLKAALEKIAGYELDNKTRNRLIELLTHGDKKIRLLSLHALKREKSVE